MKRILLGCMVFIVWLMLTWPFNSSLGYQGVLIGIIASAFVALFFGDYLPGISLKFLEPQRWIWAVYYIFVFLWYCLLGNFDVAYRVLHPKMPIKPGVVKVKTKLRNIIGVTILANSITLTPGTTTIEATDDGYLYVHWINVKTQDEQEATEIIVKKFEKILERIFE